MFAAEVRHFCWQLFRGNVRALEVLCSPLGSVIFSSPDWSELLKILNDPSKLFSKTFLDRALGQAVGAIVKKKKVNDRLVLRDDISLTKFSDSFRCAVPCAYMICQVLFHSIFAGFCHMYRVASSGRHCIHGHPIRQNSVQGWLVEKRQSNCFTVDSRYKKTIIESVDSISRDGLDTPYM